MKITDINHAHRREEFAAMGQKGDEVSHLKIEGAGVVVTIIERGDGIDITVNPSGAPYMHYVTSREVSINSTQVRVHGIRATAL